MFNEKKKKKAEWSVELEVWWFDNDPSITKDLQISASGKPKSKSNGLDLCKMKETVLDDCSFTEVKICFYSIMELLLKYTGGPRFMMSSACGVAWLRRHLP